MIIANFTPDPIDWQHIGQVGTLKPGAVEKFEDNRGKHILTKFTARGVLKLEWGDDQELKKKQAMEQYRKFWTWQVQSFNQDNQKREATKREAVPPTPLLEKKAKELGLELLGPWRAPQIDESTEMGQLKKENLELKISMGNMMSKMENLATALEKVGIRPDTIDEELTKEPEKPEEPEVVETVGKKSDDEIASSVMSDEETWKLPENKSLIEEYNHLKKDELIVWAMENLNRISDQTVFPLPVIRHLRQKWVRLYGDMKDWPLKDELLLTT